MSSGEIKNIKILLNEKLTHIIFIEIRNFEQTVQMVALTASNIFTNIKITEHLTAFRVRFIDNHEQNAKETEYMDNIKDELMKKILCELAENLIHVYGEQLKEVILYGSVAREVSTKESDIDILVLV